MTRYRDDSGSEPYSLGEGEVLRETEKAILFANEEEQFWVPKSVIHDHSAVWSSTEGKDAGELVVKTWWANKNRTANNGS
jgi:hypothetical protein